MTRDEAREQERRGRALDIAVRARGVHATTEDIIVAAGKYYDYLFTKKEN